MKDRTPTLSLDEITDNVVKIQRKMRSKLRQQEEIRRIASREDWEYVLEETSPEKVIHDANTPYRPRCADQMLVKRIMVAAQQVRLFSTVKHWTAGKHIEGIFNDSLYGRRQLLQSYLPFRPASLHESDIKEGDGNVICFGPSEIDPQAMRADTVEVLFDLDQISANNPSIFYKQRDLGFVLDKTRSISINQSKQEPLFFSHTNSVRCGSTGFSYLSVYNGKWGGIQGVTGLPNYSLISYNVQNIHQILTLNFFRFLDAKINEGFESIRNEIYADLAQLSDIALFQFLENIGRQLSDTSEFNFYGAHRIDFSTVIALSSYQDGRTASYTLNLQNLIASLERNDISILNEAKIHIPGAFSSYRFLDYLLSRTTSILGRHELQRLRSKCTTPSWVQSIPEPESLVMPIDSFAAPVLVEKDTRRPSDELITTHSEDTLHDTAIVGEVEAITITANQLHVDSKSHADEMTMSVISPSVNEALLSNIEQQDYTQIDEQSSIIPSPHTALVDTQSSLPSSFIIGIYATGSVLLITGILACALLNPVVATFVGLTLTATVVGVLATVGAVGIVAGAATIVYPWCGYFKPTDTRRVEEPIVEPQFSVQAVIA